MEIPNDDLTPDNIKPMANLREADLSEADLRGADLSEANLIRADLSGAFLIGADLSGADLIMADLSGANLAEATLSGVALSRGTQMEFELADIKEMVPRAYGYGETVEAGMGDAAARVCHELKTAYSANGLVGQARTYRIRERRARRLEAKAEGGLTGYSAWLGSLSARIVTGYGVQLRWIGGLMVLIYLLSAAIYWGPDMGLGESLYYSIVTFTTAPPYPPPDSFITEATGMGFITEAAGIIETFGGTLLIVVLGYVLDNREQV